jgi:hypothetical protein
MGKLIFHYLPNPYVDESEAGSASHIASGSPGDIERINRKVHLHKLIIHNQKRKINNIQENASYPQSETAYYSHLEMH